MKRSLYHTYQMNLGTSCLLYRTIPKNLSTKWGALQFEGLSILLRGWFEGLVDSQAKRRKTNKRVLGLR